MGQPEAGTNAVAGHADTVGREVGERPGGDRLPPGQKVKKEWPVLHYGPVPRFKPDTWDFSVNGATADGEAVSWSFEDFGSLPAVEARADFHCVTRFSMLDALWSGVAATTIVELAPPAPDVTHVTVWAEYGYSANLRISDLLQENVIFATGCDGVPLSPEHGFPLRLVVPHLYAWKGPKWVRGIEYLTADRRGFWEERGYHNIGDPWQEQRYSYQEDAGDGPPL